MAAPPIDALPAETQGRQGCKEGGREWSPRWRKYSLESERLAASSQQWKKLENFILKTNLVMSPPPCPAHVSLGVSFNLSFKCGLVALAEHPGLILNTCMWSLTPVLRSLMPSSGLLLYQTYMWHTYIHEGNTFIHIKTKFKNLLEMWYWLWECNGIIFGRSRHGRQILLVCLW